MIPGLTRSAARAPGPLPPSAVDIMIARAFSKMTPAARSMRMAGQQVRHASGLPIPPKIATPKSVGNSSSSSNTDAVVSFYKALPKGPEPEKRSGGIKGAYFDGKNASGKPIIGVIAALMIGGYILEYNGHLSTCRDLTCRVPQERAPLDTLACNVTARPIDAICRVHERVGGEQKNSESEDKSLAPWCLWER